MLSDSIDSLCLFVSKGISTSIEIFRSMSRLNRLSLLSVLFAGHCSLFFASAQIAPLRDMSTSEFLSRYREMHASPARSQVTSTGDHKCGFAWSMEAYRRSREMSPQERSELREIMKPQASDTSILSTSGFFRIHFDLTGVNSPAMLVGDTAARIEGTAVQWARKVADYFDEAFDVEVNQQGYACPPFRTGESAYDIYVIEYNGTYYGVTDWEDQTQTGSLKPTFTTYITIDNDFREFATRGLKGASVTAAHEFHHAVQLGHYGYWGLTDIFFHEMTSTFFEDEVFPGVNDYFQYLVDFFKLPNYSLYLWRGYEAVLWPKLITARHGLDVLRRSWELARSEAPMTAINDALVEKSSNIEQEYCAFTRWNWYTRERASETTTEKYSMAADIPVKMKIETTLGLPASFMNRLAPLASHYLRVVSGIDTVVFNVANVNISMALAKSNTEISYQLEVAGSQVDQSYVTAADGMWYKFTPSMENTFCVNVLTRGYVPDKSDVEVFPNPFNPLIDGNVKFALARNTAATIVSLAIYTPSMDLVFETGRAGVQRDPVYGTYVEWNGRTSKNETPASGMYIYAIQAGDDTITGKLAILKK
jgi:hypothetical protein